MWSAASSCGWRAFSWLWRKMEASAESSILEFARARHRRAPIYSRPPLALPHSARTLSSPTLPTPTPRPATTRSIAPSVTSMEGHALSVGISTRQEVGENCRIRGGLPTPLHESPARRDRHGMRPIARAKFLHDALDVNLNCFFGDEELLADISNPISFSDPAKDVDPLAW